MSAKVLLAQLRKRRQKTVDLGGGKEVTFLRPAEAEMAGLLTGEGDTRTWNVGVEQVRSLVTGWSGFTEADLLGADIGGSDVVEFDADLWAEVCSDDITWVRQIGDAILQSVVTHITERDAIAKNSEPA